LSSGSVKSFAGGGHLAEDGSIIETGRLILRPLDARDVAALYALVYADHKIRDTWSGYRETLEEFRRRFADGGVWQLESGFGFRAIVLNDTGTLIGLIGFQKHQEEPRIVFPDGERPLATNPDLVDVELTYALGRAYWNQGYATEAGAVLIAQGFDHLGIDCIVNWVDSRNAHSVGLMMRLGFRIERNSNPDELASSDRRSVLGILERRST
jgi:RimJ/RimL family protein N-acetyltransferase